MESSQPQRRFPAPWRAERDGHGFVVRDANGVAIARVYARDDLHQKRWADYWSHLTTDEARRVAKAIARLPELLTRDKTFPPRGRGRRWRESHPYHVALPDLYARERWDWIDATCRFNGVPFERVDSAEIEGARFVIFEFARQYDAIRFWEKFDGRWAYGFGFLYPPRPEGIEPMRDLKRGPTFGRR